MEMKLKDYYNRNVDGSVRAEVAFRRVDGVKESGIIPLSVFAKILGVPLVESLRWKKSDFRGMILDTSWKEHLWVSRDGESVLTWQEYNQLSSEEVSNYRRVDCMQVDVLSIFSVFHGAVQYYVCEEAVELLPEMLARDVLTGDAIIKRYLRECKHSLEFARQYGYALNRALVELNMKASDDSKEWQRALAGILAKHVGYKGALRLITDLPEIVDDDGNTVYGCDAVEIVGKRAERAGAKSDGNVPAEETAEEDASTKVKVDGLVREISETPYGGDNVAGH